MKKIVIIGRPNVGKSSLFNAILRRKIAIIDNKPGVTRDRNYAVAQFNDKYFYIIDTGGIIPDNEDDLSKSVFRQVEFAIKEADIIIFITDSKEGLNPYDKDIANILRNVNIPVFIVANKADNENRAMGAMEFHQLGFNDIFPISCLHRIGIYDLLDKVYEYLPDSNIPEVSGLHIAIIGKPNVGKSSYVNKILNQERVIVSEIPGTTRDSVDSIIKYKNRKIILIDTAGLKHKAKYKEHIDYYMFLRTVDSIIRANVVVVMIDASFDLTFQDKRIFNIVKKMGRPVIIVLNKSDLLPPDLRKKTREYFEKELHFASFAPFLLISTLSGKGVYKVIDTAIEINNNMKILTSKNLKDIRDDINEKLPFGLKYKRAIDLRNIIQNKDNPNHFNLKFNMKIDVKDFQLKYIEKAIRKLYNFKGIPIKLHW
ncbi:ribosome biogenesis GTPase Der [candidate division TA06 bacterium]|uniref:GTPase Der n=1 Tax=candidate division TA06 bacterium TaxID=2250710 RepID=A0A660SMV1_UNCT6|nr:MAG: ribosome biogenesis GTPase Der [candidate division TA06 bacterium]